MVKVYPHIFVPEDMAGLTKNYSLEYFCNAKIARIFSSKNFQLHDNNIVMNIIFPTEWCNGSDNESS